MDIEIVNLTPHSITVTAGLHQGVYPPSGKVARVDRLPFGEIVDLPAPEDGKRFIVSVIVAEAAIVKKEERNDLFCPGEQVRDAAGRIVGCCDLVHPRHATPAGAALLDRKNDDAIRERVSSVLAAGRGRDLDAAISAGYAAGELVEKVTVFTPSHQGVYRAGWAEGLAVAAVRARFAGQHRLAEALAAAGVDPCAGQPQLIEDVSVPTPRTRWRVDWSEGGCRRTGYLESDGWRWWLSLDLPLRPLFVTEAEAQDIRASQTGEYELLWRAERRGERLADRRAALAAQLRDEAQALHRRAAEVERAPSSEIDVEHVEGEDVEAGAVAAGEALRSDLAAAAAVGLDLALEAVEAGAVEAGAVEAVEAGAVEAVEAGAVEAVEAVKAVKAAVGGRTAGPLAEALPGPPWVRRRLAEALPQWSLEYGWRTSGPGPARYGWHALAPGGRRVYLGSGAEAIREAKRLGRVVGGGA